MTRPKKVEGRRQTKSAHSPKIKRTFAQGRPKGTFKKFPFEQTRLGFLLKYEMPVVYGIVMEKYKDIPFPQPGADVIELLCKASKDPTYKKPKFRRCMNEYIERGICCTRAKVLTPNMEAYYESIRKKKMEAFIARNQKKIKLYKQQLLIKTFENDIIDTDNK